MLLPDLPGLLRQIEKNPGHEQHKFTMSAGFFQTTDSPITGVSVGTKRHVIEKGRMKCNVHGRDIVIFYHDGKFYAMDQQCYRKSVVI